MRIRVSDLTAEGVLIEDHLDPAQLKDLATLQESEGFIFKGLLDVRLQVKPAAGMVEAEGRIVGTAVLGCSRCLASTPYPLGSVFRLTFTRAIPGDPRESSAEPHELQADELGLVLFEGDEIDFRDVIQEQVIMAIPMQPLCREDCRGLCARCGANLNEGPCSCSANGIDPRLAILKNIKLDS